MKNTKFFFGVLILFALLISSVLNLGVALYWSGSTVNNFVALDNVPQGAQAQLKHTVYKRNGFDFNVGLDDENAKLNIAIQGYIVDIELEKESSIGWGQYIPLIKIIKAQSDYRYTVTLYKTEDENKPLIKETGSIKMDGDFQLLGFVSTYKTRKIIERSFILQVENHIQQQVADRLNEN